MKEPTHILNNSDLVLTKFLLLNLTKDIIERVQLYNIFDPT